MDERNASTVLENKMATPLCAAPTLSPKPSILKNLWRRLHHVSPFASNVALTVSTNALIALAGLASGPICARLLGPAGRGELAALQNLYWFIAILAMLGMPEATLYFSARKRVDSSRILASAIVLVLLICPFFYLAVRSVIPMMLAAQSPAVIKTASWYLLGIPLYALAMVPLFALRGRNDMVRWNLLRIVPTFGWLFLLLGLCEFAAPSSRMIAVGYLAVLAVTLVPTFILVRRRIPGAFVPEPKRWPEMLKYGIPLAGAAVPFTLNVRLDQMIMAALLPASSLGIYVVAVSWSGAVPPILLAIGTVLFPRVAGAAPSDQGGFLAQGTRLSVIVALLLAVAVAALTPLAIPLLFGRAFAASVAVGVVLVFAAAILGVNIVFEESLRGLGATSVVFWAEAIGLVVTAVTLLALLRPLGIMGAGVASVLGYSITSGVLLSGIRRKTGKSVVNLLVINNTDFRKIVDRIAALRDSRREEA
jgi:O-antigen/teichoic acid export membrane protein